MLVTMNYQQLLLYSETKVKKVNDSGGYVMQCFFTSWNSPKRHSRKCLNCQIHRGMKLSCISQLKA